MTIRLEDRVDPTLSRMSSPQEILDKIQEAKDHQAARTSGEDLELFQRRWKILDSANGGTAISNKEECVTNSSITSVFRVLQFNAMAEGLSAQPGTGIQSPILKEKAKNKSKKSAKKGRNQEHENDPAVDFSLRRWRILEVLLGLNVAQSSKTNAPTESFSGVFDIIALQEIDRFHSFFQPMMNIMGYDGIFVPNPNSPGASRGWFSDGCALFWKRNKFELRRQASSTYSTGGNVYLIATFMHLESGRSIVCAVTHLKSRRGMDNDRIRMQQTKELMGNVVSVSNTDANISNCNVDEIPIVIMGDFNSDVRNLNSCIHAIVSYDSFHRLDSVHDINLPNSFFTTCNSKEKQILDYIFCNSETVSGVKCLETLEIPLEAYTNDSFKIPGLRHPSDHLALGAAFCIK